MRTEAQKNYYERNRESILEKQRQYDLKHAAEIRSRKKKWYIENKEEILRKRKSH